MEKKKSLIIIIILSLLLCGAIGYIVYDKVINKDNINENINENNNENNNEKEKEEEIQLNENDVTEYNNVINYITALWSDKFPINSINDMDKQQLFLILLKNMPVETKQNEFNKEELRKVADKLFGNDFKYTDESIECVLKDGYLYEYNAETGIYHENMTHGHGEYKSFGTEKYFQSATKTDTTLTINYKIIYTSYCTVCGGPFSIYKNAQDIMNNKNELYTTNGQSHINKDTINNVYNEHKDEIPTTSFIFKKDSSGNYGLKQVITK